MTDWQEVSDEQLELVRSCGPDERVMVYGGAWIKLPTDTILALLRAAFDAAHADAMARADGERVVDFDMDGTELGATEIRVYLTLESGRVVTGVGAIPDPRVRH